MFRTIFAFTGTKSDSNSMFHRYKCDLLKISFAETNLNKYPTGMMCLEDVLYGFSLIDTHRYEK